METGGLEWEFQKKQRKMWDIVSSLFTHRGFFDLVMDTISLLYMGVELEQNFGIAKIGSLFLFSSLGGSLWASLRFKGAAYVGGSSGVCGLTGGAFAEFLINWDMHKEKLKRFRSLCLGVAFNFAVILCPWADVTGNVGGLYFGFLIGFVILIRPYQETAGYEYKHSGCDCQKLILNYNQYQRVLWVIALIFTTIQFLYTLVEYILV